MLKNLGLAVCVTLIGVARVSHAANVSSESDDPGAARVLSLREQNNVSGTTGLLHLAAPGSGAAGTFRGSLLGDGYSGSGLLCTPSTPCARSTHD